MVDFTKLEAPTVVRPPTSPRDIFQQLPRPKGVGDLYVSQAEVLDRWSTLRSKRRDTIVKQPTGGGKTLIGLLIAQSLLNETQMPILYLAPTRQLVKQILSEAERFGIEVVEYLGGQGGGLPREFLASRKVCITTYNALFNAKSVFGTTQRAMQGVELGGVILDDAHAAFDILRDCFTTEIKRKDNERSFLEIVTTFSADFLAISKKGTLEEILQGRDDGVLEVPYWSWQKHLEKLRPLITPVASEKCPFVWPLIRDELAHCHVLVSKDAVSITPWLPLIDKFPSFDGCKNRVFMSATIADDSELIRAFGVSKECVLEPAASNSLAGVGERMILVPELMPLPKGTAPQELTESLLKFAKQSGLNALVLVPSMASMKKWEGLCTRVETRDQVEDVVSRLRSGETLSPIVLANRYDGIDLVGDACRILILSGIPAGFSDYDKFRSGQLFGGAIGTTLAQRIEQGIGRGARGAGDYCVVLLDGNQLVSWIGRKEYARHLTSATLQQIKIGETVSGAVKSSEEFVNTAKQCLEQDAGWKKYYAHFMASAAVPEAPDESVINIALSERRAFESVRQGNYILAIQALDAGIEHAKERRLRGVLLQWRARVLNESGDVEGAQVIQAKAHACNRQLMKPLQTPNYERLKRPSAQSSQICALFDGYTNPLSLVREVEAELVPLFSICSSSQFEEAVRYLGVCLGFNSERPEQKLGPDNLWVTTSDVDFVIEVKSNKQPDTPLKKEEAGQLHVSLEWYRTQYPDSPVVGVIVHHNSVATENAIAKEAFVLTVSELRKLAADVKGLLLELSRSGLDKQTMLRLCDEQLLALSLTPALIVKTRLGRFRHASSV